MMRIYQVESDKDRDTIRELFCEYLKLANTGLNEQFGINFAIEQMIEEDMLALNKFYPPQGRLLLAELDNRNAGLACMYQIREDMGEIKRMYVRDEFRGARIGQALLDRLIIEAREIGYAHLQLDSARFMHTARRLYRSAGIEVIEPYAKSEIPERFQTNWIFMERELQPGRFADR